MRHLISWGHSQKMDQDTLKSQNICTEFACFRDHGHTPTITNRPSPVIFGMDSENDLRFKKESLEAIHGYLRSKIVLKSKKGQISNLIKYTNYIHV